MKHSNFTILRKRTQQNKLALKADLYSFFFILTMFIANISLSASNEFTDMNLFLSSTQETCSGSSDGSVSVLVTGGTPSYTYAWNTGATTDVVYNLTSGIYIVTVTDSQGDTAIDSIEVEISPEGLWIMISTTEDAGCGPNGIAHVSAMTGVPPYLYQWDDPATQTTEDAFNLYPGVYTVTVTDSNGCTAIDSTLVAGEDGISLGDFVFQDFNKDGIQQPWEAGVANIYVELYSAGFDGSLFTNDDVQEDWEITGTDGRYVFECVDPGYYYIKFSISANDYNISPPYQGNDDELDSNADPVTGNTEAFTVTQGMPDDLSYDAGVFDVCDDFTYGGTIGQSQIICPGDEPETLHTIIPPSGGSGTPEYLWLKSTAGGTFPGPSWVPIPGSNTENYDPGPLYISTYYIRCIRREGCNSFLTESENQVSITVLDANDEYCVGENIDPFNPDITADIMAQEEVMIQWTTDPENELYYYYVERSFDSINFEAIAVLRGTANVDDSSDYEFMDTEPLNGRNIYRIKRIELISETAVYSNSVEIFFVGGDQSFMLYPNPVSNLLKIETSQSKTTNTTLRMYNAMGQLLDIVELVAGETSTEINMKDLPSGIYFIHIPGNSDYKFEILKVLKK